MQTIAIAVKIQIPDRSVLKKVGRLRQNHFALLSLYKDQIMNIKGKVLVTGATGSVALHCIAKFLKNGYEVVGTLRSKSRDKEV